MSHRFSLANSIVNRSIIGSVYFAVLLIFYGAQSKSDLSYKLSKYGL
jgi:hypothetical protein